MKLSKSLYSFNYSFSVFLKRGVGILLFIVLCSFAKADQTSGMLDSANSAYSKGDFQRAITQYEGIRNKGLESAELYFNLGNAYFKTNNIAFAVLNYERAKKISPNDEDIAVNLKLVNQKIEDKIDAAPQLFLTQWKNGLVDLMSEKAWSILCILLITIALILYAIFISFNNRAFKQIGFFGGTIFIVSAIATFFIAQHKYTLTKNNTDAIITSASVTVMGSPNEKGTKLFILHEGTKVDVTQENDGWTEIKIANGNVGWIKGKDVTSI